MYIYENYVIDAPERKKANFKIVPFLESDIAANRKLYNGSDLDSYFTRKFPYHRLLYTERGRSGIPEILRALKLQKEAVVTILTTTNNFYISSCVTREIETICRWSRSITKETKAILVNHEFGYCYEDLTALKQYGLPIIEDFAHSFSAQNSTNTQGTIGDFLIFSFSKFFPIQIGGALLYRPNYNIAETINSHVKCYIKNIVGSHLKDIKTIEQKRLENYFYLKKLFDTLNCYVYFQPTKGFVPAVFMFRPPEHVDLLKLKEFMNAQGVESSVFYGEHAYFIPSHQNFSKEDLFFFYTLVKYFLQQNTTKALP